MAKNKKSSRQLEKFRATFFEECADRLGELEDILDALNDADKNTQAEMLDALFRSVHSIKGGAGAFDFITIVDLSQALEAALDHVRAGKVSLSKNVIGIIIEGRDLLAETVESEKSGKIIDTDKVLQLSEELSSLGNVMGPKTPTGTGPDVSKRPDTELPPTELKHYSIKFKPTARLFEAANDPLLLIRELRELGSLKTSIDTRQLPPLTKLNPLESYLMWTFELAGNMSVDDIKEVFEFVDDACALRIEQVDSDSNEGNNDNGDLTQTNTSEPSKAAPSSSPPTPAQPPTTVAKNVQPPATTSTAQKITSVRVDLDRIDTLVNMVGELVITQAMMEQYAAADNHLEADGFQRGVETMSSHMRDLQDSVMAVRMQPVKTVFSRMPRLARELSRKLGKKVNLVLKGEDTEVDKTIIELLADPLTHMIRNSLDHGIELPDVRTSAGKPAEAEIVLSADQRSGRIIIEVVDDGAGINRDRVFSKAVEQGIVAPDAALKPDEIDDLIFAPGFSTAEEVTDVSGRGVGMDVVRRSVQDLGGRVSVTSTPGQGAKFLMALPLTLAVMDGMIVKVGREKFILPLAIIIESLQPSKGEVETVMDRGRLIKHRGEFVPLISLATLFNDHSGISDPSEGLVVFVETGLGNILGLIVDKLLGQNQVVIKSLEENFLRIEGVSAATILGDGRVALILDVDGIENMVLPGRGLMPKNRRANLLQNEVSL